MQTGVLILFDDDESWMFINETEKRGIWLDTKIKSEAIAWLEQDGWEFQWTHPNKEEHKFHKYT